MRLTRIEQLWYLYELFARCIMVATSLNPPGDDLCLVDHNRYLQYSVGSQSMEELVVYRWDTANGSLVPRQL